MADENQKADENQSSEYITKDLIASELKGDPTPHKDPYKDKSVIPTFVQSKENDPNLPWLVGGAGAATGWHIGAQSLAGPNQTLKEGIEKTPSILQGPAKSAVPEFIPGNPGSSAVTGAPRRVVEYVSDVVKGPHAKKHQQLGDTIVGIKPPGFEIDPLTGQAKFPPGFTWDDWVKLQNQAYDARIPHLERIRRETATPWAPYQGSHIYTEWEANPATMTPGSAAPTGPGSTAASAAGKVEPHFGPKNAPDALPPPPNNPQLSRPGGPPLKVPYEGGGAPPSTNLPTVAPESKPFHPLDVRKKPSVIDRASEKAGQVIKAVPGGKAAISGASKALDNPWVRRGLGALSGAGAGLSALDAVKRYNNQDYLGSGLSGLSSLGYGIGLIPHPAAKVAGFGIGLTADAGNYLLDKYRENRK